MVSVLTNALKVPLWRSTQQTRPKFEGAADVDVVIIGAGYTGLWTAYYLLKANPGLNIVILEQKYVGFGASGRNGGWVSSVVPFSLNLLAQKYSKRSALELQLAMNESIDEIKRVLEEEKIEADYNKSGLLFLARNRAHFARMDGITNEAKNIGLNNQWQILGKGQAKEYVQAAGIKGGVFTKHCALIHPGKLVSGLADTVERLGAKIFESSTVEGIIGNKVALSDGEIEAQVIVRATEAFGVMDRALRRQIVPIYSCVLATEPLGAEVLERSFHNGRIAFNDLAHVRNYAQLTADNRLVFGGRGAFYNFGSKLKKNDGVIDAIHHKIYKDMLSFFPDLREVSISNRWGGALAVSRDWWPRVAYNPSTGYAEAGCYFGDGVATSNLCGRILKNLILGVPEDINTLAIVNHQSPLWEPEPLRWLGVNTALFSLVFGDHEEKLTHKDSFVVRGINRFIN